jgi:cellulose synthase/poly-beta-1,6-N-acetylglucosamine synthase-like glycosyltransferase
VSDGSTDGTDAAVQEFANRGIELHRVEQRKGKANALNIGISHCHGEIVVFTDASIILEPQTLRALIRPFSDPTVGCVSGEDHISGAAGEGLYGRYELFLRNQESRFCSIVGASGSIYAQRLSLCRRFVEGLAPDFLSVLVTVEQRYRAITERDGKGTMTAVSDPAHEFRRKVRTLLRGMSTLWYGRSLLNPLRYGCFAFCLVSHKLLRWFVPIFLVASLMSSLALAEEPFYALALCLQLLFYACAVLAWYEVLGVQNSLVGKVPLFFSIANLAVIVASFKFLSGSRQEIWEPTKRH